jgi:hypothetical protein
VRGVRFVKLAEAPLAMLLLTAKRVAKRNHAISFRHAGADYTFFDAASPIHRLPDGTELLGYFDGADAAVLHCTDLDGRYLGALKRRKAVDIRDRQAISAAAGAVQALVSAHVHGPVQARHAIENAQLGAHLTANRAKLLAWGVPENKLPAPAGLSAKLAAPAPDRAAQSEQRATLATAIAATKAAATEAATAAAARRSDDDLDPSALL